MISRNPWVVALLLPALLLGCDGGGGDGPVPITKTRVVSTPDKRIDPSASEAQRFGYARPGKGGQAKPGQPAAAFQLHWQTPKGWKELNPTSNRTANFKIPSAPTVECYLTKLFGRAGGVAANVNRWRGQYGLPPLSGAELGRLPHKKVLGGTATFVEMSGTFRDKPNQKLFGLILPFRGQTIFVKMTGPSADLDRHREGLEFFLRSLIALRPGQKRLPKKAPEVKVPRHAGKADTKATVDGFGITLHWQPPEGWVQGVKKRMRLITFKKEPGLDLYLSVFRPAPIASNINRWRGQMGAKPFSEQEIKDLPTIEVLGRPAPLLEVRGTFKGMGGPSLENAMMMGTIVSGPKCTIYIKLTGPEDAVQAQRQAFIAFCTSLRIAK